MIKFATNDARSGNINNVEFLVKDAGQLDCDWEFDTIFSNAALHWVPDHPRLLRAFYRALNPGGRLLLQMGGRGNAQAMVNTVENMVLNDKWRDYLVDLAFPWGFYGIDEYRLWLEQAGFKVSRVELVQKDMVHSTREGLAGWFRTTWLPYIQRIPQVMQEEFIDETIKSYLDLYPPDENGFNHLGMVRLEAEAEK
ncbi:MAG: class I SAM-dependent methyltransferase [Chitinophagales bacterium]